MAKLLDPGRQITDSTTAIPVASGAAYFADPGTTNEKTVYSDAALSAAISQPITLNSEGRFPAPPYGSGEFRLTVFDSTDTGSRDGVETFDEDNIRGADPIGSAALTAPLLLDDSTSATVPVMAFDGDTDTGIIHPAANVVGIATAGAEALRVLANGNVGIGTTAPAYPLDVDTGTANAAQVRLGVGAVLLTSASRSYTPTTGAQNLFDFTLAVANCAFKVTAIFEDVNFANGSIIWELYIGVLGSGTTLSSATITQEDKHRIASGSLTSYGTWAVSVASNKLRLTHTGTVAGGIGTLSLSVVSTTVTAPVADV